MRGQIIVRMGMWGLGLRGDVGCALGPAQAKNPPSVPIKDFPAKVERGEGEMNPRLGFGV